MIGRPTLRRRALSACCRCPQCGNKTDRLLADGRGGLCGICLRIVGGLRAAWLARRRAEGLCTDCGHPKEEGRMGVDVCQGCATHKKALALSRRQYGSKKYINTR